VAYFSGNFSGVANPAFPVGVSMSADNFAGRLKELREQAGLSQEELADRAGLNKFSVARYEQGRRMPAWGSVIALARALGVKCDAFEVPPATVPEPKRGRPPKPPADAEVKPKRPRGRPKKGA
jgi:transcriptional regulator with XRE-family HTH domain